MEEPILFTERAVQQVAKLLQEEDNPNLFLRVYITGGGCAGFQYGFTFDDALLEDDTVIEKGGVKIAIDALSLPYLKGAEIDYKDDIEGASFVIRNPNAKTTCGCGASFAV